MEKEEYKKRFDEIHHFIINIATGNFSFKLEPKDDQDEIETMVMLLNMMAEELRILLHKVNMEESTSQILQMGFTLDQDFKILGYTQSVPEILKLDDEVILSTPFKNILSSNSGKEFQNKIRQINKLKRNETVRLDFSLEFRSSESLIIPAEGSIQRLHAGPERRFLIVAFKTIYKNKILEEMLKASIQKKEPKINYPSENQILRLESNRELFKKLHFYIHQNLDKPLPKFREIAREMGASESKLKKGFRKMYGTTIYHYHREKRLEKAVMLLSNTEQSIKQISIECGFTSFPHFSRTFKERFGFSPSQLRNS